MMGHNNEKGLHLQPFLILYNSLEAKDSHSLRVQDGLVKKTSRRTAHVR